MLEDCFCLPHVFSLAFRGKQACAKQEVHAYSLSLTLLQKQNLTDIYVDSEFPKTY